jgi:hypothetical protein
VTSLCIWKLSFACGSSIAVIVLELVGSVASVLAFQVHLINIGLLSYAFRLMIERERTSFPSVRRGEQVTNTGVGEIVIAETI